MIQPYVDKLIASKDALVAEFRKARPDSYDALVNRLVALLANEDDFDSPDPTRVHIIDDGHYQGTRLYIIGSNDYQPSRYWSIFVSYGSCSGCDTFEAIGGYSDDEVTEEEASEYYTLMLHMVQSMRQLNDADDVPGDSATREER